jgi:hypothetical protein
VSIYSRVTDEDFRGEVTAVSGADVHVRLGGNIPTRMHLDHIASGRLRVRRLGVR